MELGQEAFPKLFPNNTQLIVQVTQVLKDPLAVRVLELVLAAVDQVYPLEGRHNERLLENRYMMLSQLLLVSSNRMLSSAHSREKSQIKSMLDRVLKICNDYRHMKNADNVEVEDF